ncbi:chymotrypsin-C-like [Rhopilema esculentum]|uniref:chymotrypsin-C-like n=1 Tax=Rhopilema esculentum TaxID=499914 RepID=UPI0031DE0F62
MLWFFVIGIACTSGSSIRSSERYRRFVNSRDAKKEEWKFHAKFKYNHAANVAWKTCSGALIESRWLLTAAHCVRNRESININASDFSVILHEGVDRVVEHAVAHFYTPPYPNVEHTRMMFDNDIALVQLEKEAPEFMEKIQYRSTPRRLFNCTAAGWGATKQMTRDDYKTGNYHLAKKLKEIDGSVVDFKTFCKGFEPSKKICFAKTDKDMIFTNGGCIGDSGSPIVCESEKGKFLLGISIGGDIECKPNAVIATDVRAWVRWLASRLYK